MTPKPILEYMPNMSLRNQFSLVSTMRLNILTEAAVILPVSSSMLTLKRLKPKFPPMPNTLLVWWM